MGKLKIKKNDTVLVLTGNSKGTKGKVIKVFPNENRAIVEGVNMSSKHTKPNAANPQGGILKQERPDERALLARARLVSRSVCALRARARASWEVKWMLRCRDGGNRP